MSKRLFHFEVYKKSFIIWFIIIFSILNAVVIDASSSHYNLGKDYLLFSDQEQAYSPSLKQQNIDYDLYLKNKINEIQTIIDEEGKNKELENELVFTKYLVNHKLVPLNLGIDFNHIGDVNGATAIYISIKEMLPLIVPLLSLLLVLHSFQSNKKNYNYLMTLPIKKKSIFFAKISSIILVAFGAILSILLLAFIKGLVIGGVGQFQYPILLDTSNVNSVLCTQYIPLWGFIILALGIYVIQIILYTLIGILIIKLIQNKWLQYFVTFIIGSLPIIYTFTANQPIYANTEMSLIPFINDKAYYIITYGFPMILLIAYFGFIFTIILLLYKAGLKYFREYNI